MKYVSALTDGAGTLYALLERFEKDGLIGLSRVEDGRKYYRLAPKGARVLEQEYRRIRRQASDMERALREEAEG